jgi:hypothetical protein
MSMKFWYCNEVRDIPVRIVNALYELHLIIEEVRKNYAQSRRWIDINQSISYYTTSDVAILNPSQ